jgi:NADH-quinone oxidoreductase subunit L
VTALLAAMLAFPLAGAVLQAGLGQRLGRRGSGILASLAMLGALLAALVAVNGLGVKPHTVSLGHWMAFDGFSADFSLRYDRIAAMMTATVTFVALCIHVYSATFMRHDENFARYFCYLNLFVFFMLVIALADDLVFCFLGWEGVGFCSFALIGFWHDKPANVDAGRKAFLMTRVGDLGFVAALAILVSRYGQASLSELAVRAPSMSLGLATALGFCFLFAALGKSAQLPLTAWLPDAMAGPTPVSALIHAATMVTAGVYLLVRLEPLLPHAPDVGATAAVIGAVTALYGAACALAQRDVKRILAYSTISQVGYMFLAAGCGDMIGAMFHLQTHAFFKSLLFLCAGVMIQVASEEHDIFRMGEGLRRAAPGLFPLFACGAAALAGVPLTSGYMSKGRILADALEHPGGPFLLCFILGTVAAFLTSLYVFRLFFVAFFSVPSEPAPLTISPVTRRMLWPLVPLAGLALVYGLINPPDFLGMRPWLDSWLAGTVAPSPPDVEALSPLVDGLDALMAFFGIGLAWLLYAPARLRRPRPDGAFTAGLGLDAAYRRFLAAPYVRLAAWLWRRLDVDVVDGAFDALADGITGLSGSLRQASSARVSISLATLLAAAAAVATWLALAWT